MAQRVRQGGVRCPQGERQLSYWISEGPTKEASRSGLSKAFESCWISCDNLGYKLAEEFFWYNSAKLPSPIEWVNKWKVRVKDSVNTVWWFSKTDDPKADVRQVLVPYSARMKTLLVGPGEVLCTKGKTIWP